MPSEKLNALLERLASLEDKQLFFLGGVVKSGTTWVERVLDAHPQVVCKGEAHFGTLLEPALRDAIAAYNAVIPKKGNWSRHRREGTQEIPPSTYSFLTGELEFLYAQAIRLMLLKWLETPEVKCIGEKTPNNSRYFQRFKRIFPGARFIYVVRDVRDVTVSGWFFNLAVGGKETLSRFRTINEYAIHLAGIWAQDVAEGLRFVADNGRQAVCVRYEDLWQRPEQEATRLFDFLDVESGEREVQSCLTYTDFARLSGGRARGIENRSSFYRKGIIGDWKNHLDAGTVGRIEAVAGALMERLGYDQARD